MTDYVQPGTDYASRKPPMSTGNRLRRAWNRSCHWNCLPLNKVGHNAYED
eukprot:CAMPEP_0181028582 /NCGR_PEP_ID=MMETSP1070-20121207/4746_1 /TAXON_ID=265543 /ORGANISM="Minutocellus polymorphus, Strain NH13" /LENGTH=49 /DNA_ID=CAMNT_0023105843 /DNA_START=680 /DNA_END=829 /DNA_ORIENTATION=+